MTLEPLELEGAFLVVPERLEDERGYFARTFCTTEFEALGLESGVRQCSTSFNSRTATLRGMHYQEHPHGECKLVRCTRGCVFDVIVDLRPESATYLSWVGIELSAANGLAIYIPQAMAHGFVTLHDEAEVSYQISVPYRSDATRGVRWDDPAFGIDWPVVPMVMSDRDRHFADYVA